MSLFKKIFSIRREERLVALAALLLFLALNALCIRFYYDDFSVLGGNYWHTFISKFHISGFDPVTYYIISHWEARYNVYRHPLLSFIMYVPYLVNQALMFVFGINCAQFVVAFIIIASAFYAFIFLYRIFREIIDLRRSDAILLGFLMYSFAYVMLSAMVPDHFIMSMCLLLLTLYVCGMQVKARRPLATWQTLVLFVLTAGVSLNNGLKVFMGALFVNGKRFFRPRYLLLAVILPSALMWAFTRIEYRYFVWENEVRRTEARKFYKEKRAKEQALQQKRQDSIIALHKAQGDTTANTANSKPKVKKKPHAKAGKPFMKGEFMNWTDKTTSRWDTTVENLFGESIQLHTDHLLGDVLNARPMIVRYKHWINYAVEITLVLLFVLGIWCGRHARFLWLSLSFFGLDMLLHIGLGFAINEVYIMAAHWIYAIPIAIAYLIKTWQKLWIRLLILLLTLYLYAYNGFLIIRFFTT